MKKEHKEVSRNILSAIAFCQVQTFRRSVVGSESPEDFFCVTCFTHFPDSLAMMTNSKRTEHDPIVTNKMHFGQEEQCQATVLEHHADE